MGFKVYKVFFYLGCYICFVWSITEQCCPQVQFSTCLCVCFCNHQDSGRPGGSLSYLPTLSPLKFMYWVGDTHLTTHYYPVSPSLSLFNHFSSVQLTSEAFLTFASGLKYAETLILGHVPSVWLRVPCHSGPWLLSQSSVHGVPQAEIWTGLHFLSRRVFIGD